MKKTVHSILIISFLALVGGTVLAVDADGDGHHAIASGGDDCNDNDDSIYPGALEIPGDGIDQDCDGAELCFCDTDNDGWRPDAVSTVMSTDLDCDDLGEAYEPEPIGDCDDANPSIHPTAIEFPGDGIDQDCDSAELCFCNTDNDGWRPDAVSTVMSTDLDCADSGEAYEPEPIGDCDDANPSIHPAAVEFPGDGVDQDCDGYDWIACLYVLAGDWNRDCRVNLNDLAILAANWLVDCLIEPVDAACILLPESML